MGRYDAEAGVEGEHEAGSRGRVLRNLLGIRGVREMNREEARRLFEAQKKLVNRRPAVARMSAAFLCDMHQEWLGGVYAWAGRYRTVEMSKGGFAWPPARLVAQNMDAFEREVLSPLTPCQRGSDEEICMAMAKVQADLLMIHPFREGNGRLSRWVCDLMALQAGRVVLNYAFRGRGGSIRRAAYLRSVVAGYGGNYRPLALILRDALERGRFGGERSAALSPRAPSK
jgi:cell filamentation protein